MSADLKLSILINNYNYAPYLRDSIQSALDQTYPDTEVVVVDDGSTDDSRDVIGAYGDRVIPVFRANGGQGAAMNSGFAASRGDIVIFLDSDDTLDPEICQRVVDTFVAEPDLVKVQYRLRVVDSHGAPTLHLFPPHWQPLPTGDLREHVAQHYTYNYPPTSGNAFAASALRTVFPIPEDVYRIGSDQYLHDTVVLIGPIRSLPGTGGTYRIHPGSLVGKDGPVPEVFRTEMRLNYHGFTHVRRIANSVGIPGYPQRYEDIRDRRMITHRIVSLKAEPENHPIPSDRLLKLFWNGCAAALKYPGVPVYRRIIHCIALLVFVLSPRAVARWLAIQHVQLIYPDISASTNGNRSLLRRLMTFMMPRPRSRSGEVTER